MTKLYLIRHGETEENAQRILQGILPGHLNETGKQQARQLLKQLASTHFDALVSSDLKRAVDTADILNEQLQLPLTLCPLLRERDWGELTGYRTTELKIKSSDFPPSVENPEQLLQRAHRCLHYLDTHFHDKKVLVVGHGYFNRCLLAAFYGKTPHDIPRWGNAELRTVQFEKWDGQPQSFTDSQPSAD